MLSEELAVLERITDTAVRLAGAGLQEQADWAGKQAALLASALAKRYWEEPEVAELPCDKLADGGIGLGKGEAEVVEVEEAHEVGGAVSWRTEGSSIVELTIDPVEGVALSAAAEGAGVEAVDGGGGEMADEEFPATKVRLPRRKRG